eukprot:1147225-Prymnesium_polylepis.1
MAPPVRSEECAAREARRPPRRGGTARGPARWRRARTPRSSREAWRALAQQPCACARGAHAARRAR